MQVFNTACEGSICYFPDTFLVYLSLSSNLVRHETSDGVFQWFHCSNSRANVCNRLLSYNQSAVGHQGLSLHLIRYKGRDFSSPSVLHHILLSPLSQFWLHIRSDFITISNTARGFVHKAMALILLSDFTCKGHWLCFLVPCCIHKRIREKLNTQSSTLALNGEISA